MTGGRRRRFWVEAGLSGASAALAILTLITREWIEALTGWDPDHGNGSVEWAVALGLAVAALVFALIARAEFHRAGSRPGQAGNPA